MLELWWLLMQPEAFRSAGSATRWWVAYAYAVGRFDQHQHANVPYTNSVDFADEATRRGLRLARFSALYEQMASAETEREAA
jgi:hypothetical protein